jgi:hypothetical protein
MTNNKVESVKSHFAKSSTPVQAKLQDKLQFQRILKSRTQQADKKNLKEEIEKNEPGFAVLKENANAIVYPDQKKNSEQELDEYTTLPNGVINSDAPRHSNPEKTMTFGAPLEVNSTLQELLLAGNPTSKSESHVSFPDKLWPVSELIATQNGKGSVALQINAPAYDVKRMETHMDSLRKRLSVLGHDIESISIGSEDDAMAAVLHGQKGRE